MFPECDSTNGHENDPTSARQRLTGGSIDG